MLLWNELINEARELEQDTTASKDDLRLLQIYLCRLYLTPAYENTLSLFNAEESLAFLGIKPPEDADTLGTRAHLNIIRKREKALTFSLKGKPKLSFEPLLASLVKLLKPNLVETKLLVYAMLLLKHPQAQSVLRELEISELNNSVNALARAMRESSRTVARALEDDSMLRQIRLFETPNRGSDIWDLVEAGPLLGQLVLATSDGEKGQSESDIEQMLFRHVCPPGPEAQHQISEFQGVPELQLMLDYLQNALATKARGKNILLYGKPGTGKTQLARAMAEKLSAPLYEVPTKDGRSGAMTGRIRLDAAKLAQMFLEDRLGAILLFDEMEDAFRKADDLAKGWFNQLLEENQAPAIWISNNISAVDSAFLRRFDFIFEVEGSGTDQQAEKLERDLSALPVSQAWITEAARTSWMTPALAKNLLEVAQYLPARQIIRNQQRLETLMHQRLSAMGERKPAQLLKRKQTQDFPEFRQEWINTKPTLKNVERLVRKEGAAKVCLYGPPGAGKTAYAQELAKRLEKPFMLQSGSDLLDKFIGETEKNIAAMFDKAERTGAVLLLDEADTFLYSRGMAQSSWEVSAVNEFMIRLERFEGVLLATTNRFDSLDKAILRRFHLKVKLGYLSTDQLKELIEACVMDKDKARALRPDQLAQFVYLTPGLVRGAVQGLRLRGFKPRTERLLEALKAEQSQQTDGVIGQPIGFVQ
ncbi:AAA+-type ATPase, SpoVK/Ycf46/Vps4 family [Marinobacter sp. LV10R510-11A]|uniref:AAA family ATPase n=1 Tax=Marinobacter sp. LV10R510-11A TaxID=1415568 RepID=UPI000BB6D056|nr:ATP-binding protein [Marinobacter sp. LV10R510-11A]SOB74726.1 AAA+-type ATPase, SpoVK/Ycf46/Vps4 family [Marinobacter sp. LV10R510-11A]